MEFNNRKPNRLAAYDYSRAGVYFITICVQDRRPILSRIPSECCAPDPRTPVGEGLAPPLPILLPFGKIADEQLKDLPRRFPGIAIDHAVIMPNHIHILLRLDSAGGASPSPTVSEVIGAYKSLTTRACKQYSPVEKLFQRSFYDHIIRDEADYRVRWQYIDENPARWVEDEFFTGPT